MAPTSTAASARIEMYDTTLRDGTQGLGVHLTLVDKLKIAQHLDRLGFDFIEGGYPLSNPKDVAFFEQARDLDWAHAKITAFGMTRRKGINPADDPGMQALVGSGAPVITIVGKTWDLHVDEVLRVEREENLAMIRESLAFCRDGGAEVFYDAEHFFDGYHANPDYARATLRAAIEGGATRLVLCDTNGGTLPEQLAAVIDDLKQTLQIDSNPDPGSLPSLAIHCHNDSGVAVANSLTAVAHGCVQVQGTINGIGERCGNVDLIPVAANLQLKQGFSVLQDGSLQGLVGLSQSVYELSGVEPVVNQPYVSDGAFAHKGGMHVHAVQRIAHSYEHIEPSRVGNERRILVSELSGASNIAATLGEKFPAMKDDKTLQRRVLERVQDLEHEGYRFEDAPASLELLMHEALGSRPALFELDHYRCVILKRDHESSSTEATVKLSIDGDVEHRVAEGDGPVDALAAALRKCLTPHDAGLAAVHLTDYQVRVVNPTAETAARVRVTVTFEAKRPDRAVEVFATVGVNENIVDASWEALVAGLEYHRLSGASEVSAASPA